MKRTTAKFLGTLVRRLMVAIAVILGSAQMAAADPAVWVVKNGNSTLYLMGTLAIMKMDSSRWYTPKIDGVLQAIDEYWMAHDQLADDAIGKTYTMNFGVDYQHPLAEKLGPEDYALLEELLQKHGVGEGEIRFFRPWAATLTLQSRVFKANGYVTSKGADGFMASKAREYGKEIKFLETATEQLGHLARLSQAAETDLLRKTVHEIAADTDGSKVKARSDAIGAAWIAGDMKSVAGLTFMQMSAKSPDVHNALLTERDAAWMPKILPLLQKPGTFLVAVGELHVTRRGGILDLLKKSGFKVRRY